MGGTDWVGRQLDVEIGAPGHGGFCVARAEGRVVFVRHALPGERVRAIVTEDSGGGFCRADAIEILGGSPHRVAAPCPHAGPGRCGGCDWQHASGDAQRRLKAAVVREQFTRLAGVSLELDAVEPLPGGLLGWRTRVAFAVGPDGTVGLHKHRSAEVEPVAHCPLGTAAVSTAPAAPSGALAVEQATDDDGAVTVLAHHPGRGRQARGRRPPDAVSVIAGPEKLRHRVGRRDLRVSAAGFWQVHPAALDTFAAALLGMLEPRPGESVLELYAGAGALTSVLADAVGATGRVLGLESAPQAVADAADNLAGRDWAQVVRTRVDPGAIERLELRPDLIVLDPPRAGAGIATMATLVALEPRRIGYVSCDPATLARDVRVALDHGWRLAAIRAFDAFPMTAHVECVVALDRATRTIPKWHE